MLTFNLAFNCKAEVFQKLCGESRKVIETFDVIQIFIERFAGYLLKLRCIPDTNSDNINGNASVSQFLGRQFYFITGFSTGDKNH